MNRLKQLLLLASLSVFFFDGCATRQSAPILAPLVQSKSVVQIPPSAPMVDLNPADATTNASQIIPNVVIAPPITNILNLTWTPNYTVPGEYTVIATNSDLILPRAQWGIYTNVAGGSCSVVSMSPQLFASAYNAVSSVDWQGLDYFPGYFFFGTSTATNELCEFPLQQVTAHAGFPAFLVQTSAAPFSIVGEQIGCSLQISSDPDAVIFFGGQDNWSNGGLPANARFFFSTVTGYDNEGAATNYWFSAAPWIQVSNNITGSLSVTVTNFADWSDGQGQSDSDAFFYAASNVTQIGLTFGGGSYYDVGIAVSNGTAVFHLTSFSEAEAVAPTKISGGF